MKKKLNIKNITSIKAQSRDFIVFDTSLKGFGLKITPTGRKVFIFQYRMRGKGNPTRRVTIGVYRDQINDNGQDKTLTVNLARKKAEMLRGLVNANIDPSANRDKRKNTKTIKSLIDEFKTSHMKTNLKNSTYGEYVRAIENYIIPRFGNKLIVDIQRDDVSKLHRCMNSKLYQANRTIAVFRKFFNWCEQNGFRQLNSNPCAHIEKYPEKSRDRYLSAIEQIRLAKTLDALSDHRKESPYTIAAIRLLLLTGARRSEILKMKWEWIDLNEGTLRLPDSKTGPKTIFLNSVAIDILMSLPRTSGNPYVIEGNLKNAHLVNIQKGWVRIRTLANLQDVRIHDLRHTYASAGVMNGLSLPVIGGLLGHSQPSTTNRYAHLANTHLRTANEELGQVITVSMKN